MRLLRLCYWFGHVASWPKATSGAVLRYECQRCFAEFDGVALWDLEAPKRIYKTRDRRLTTIARVLPDAYRFGRKRA